MSAPLLQVIVGSTRPGRVGRAVADWFATTAAEDGRFAVEVVDLAEVGLPILDEPNHPRLRDYRHGHTKRWSATIDRADAFTFVIPEYNSGMNSATKNAIDYLFHEWARKPLGIVSYGGVSGGLKAAQQLKNVGAALRMPTMPDTVMIPMVASMIDDEGRFTPTRIVEESADALIDELVTLTGAMAQVRARS